MSQPLHAEPSFIRKGNVLNLSGPALIEVLTAVLKKGARFRFQAKGFSMFPFIRNEDMITVSQLSGGRACLGDILAFFNPKNGHLVIHRVVARQGNYYLMKGDNTGEVDGLIPAYHILGLVTRVERRGKRVFVCIGFEKYIIAFLSQKNILLPLQDSKKKSLFALCPFYSPC